MFYCYLRFFDFRRLVDSTTVVLGFFFAIDFLTYRPVIALLARVPFLAAIVNLHYKDGSLYYQPHNRGPDNLI